MQTPLFTTKEEYLEYRSNWKAEYKKLSQQIRKMKEEHRELQRKHRFTWKDYLQLRKLKDTATAMLEERKESKQEAQRQYLESKKLTLA